jgi:hypothetical protein
MHIVESHDNLTYNPRHHHGRNAAAAFLHETRPSEEMGGDNT